MRLAKKVRTAAVVYRQITLKREVLTRAPRPAKLPVF